MRSGKCAQLRTHCFGGDVPIGLQGEIRDQLLVSVGQPCCHDARLPNAGDFEQRGFNFVGGHLIAADLDLEVLPAPVLQDAVGIHADRRPR